MFSKLLSLCGFAAGGGEKDPFWSNVVLLALNDNKANATTSFADQSTWSHTLTAVGSAQYSTAQAPSGMTSSALFDGTTDRISIPDSSAFDLGSGDFTIEGWIRNTVNSGYKTLIAQFPFSGGVNYGWWVVGWASGDPNIYFEWSTTGTGYTFSGRSHTPVVDTWYHYAVCRSGSTLRQFIDGTQIGADLTFTDTIFNSAADVLIGGNTPTGGYDHNGHICSIRVTKAARYTANFTVPRLPLPTR